MLFYEPKKNNQVTSCIQGYNTFVCLALIFMRNCAFRSSSFIQLRYTLQNIAQITFTSPKTIKETLGGGVKYV